jgi:SPP1 gp7 family putative phage head morphogenesis protein
MAESLELPSRIALYQLYNEIALDSHIHGVIQQRVNRLLGLNFQLVNEAGEEVPEAMKLFETSWFYKFLELAIESRWWSHSLIQLWDENENGYGTVKLVPRKHVIPNKGYIMLQQEDSTTVIHYREPMYFNYLIEVGEEMDLGLFNRAAPNFIIKKNAMVFWSKYTELFAMPIRVGKTASRNQADMNRMADNLRKMEAAAYGVFQEGETIEFIESTKGDAYQVYKQLIDTCDAQLSKLFVGQTMTTDNGSSKSQSEVHERVADGIGEADKRFIQFVVNDQLLPKMASHGFKVAGLRFVWAQAKNKKQQFDMAVKLLEKYDIDAQYIADEFGIPVTAKAATEPTGEPVKKKVATNLSAELDTLYANSCNHIHLAQGEDAPEPIDIDALARFIYDNQDRPDVLHDETYLQTANQLYDAFKNGFGSGFTDGGATALRTNIQRNIYPFSAAKTLTQMNEMRDLISDGNTVLSFDDFKKKIADTGIKFNKSYLAAEYNYAIASGQAAMNWQQYEADKALYPNLRYETVGDDRVRETHFALEGTVAPVDSPFWNENYPPNDWGCRCEVIQEDTDTALTPLPSRELQRKAVPPLFRNNVGKTQVVFKGEHPYMTALNDVAENGMRLTYEQYNLKPIAQLRRGNNAAPDLLTSTKDYDKWRKGNKELGTIDGEVLVNKLPALNETDTQWQHASAVNEVLTAPNEVWLTDLNNGEIWRTYIKHYNEYSVMVVSEWNKSKQWELRKFAKHNGASHEMFREGALLYIKK